MGALSFAADTLASLSAAFASKNPPPSQVSLTNLTLELDSEAHRVFNEFSTGMKMLYQHGTRNPCNVTSISQQNLKLLYTNLKSNPSFKSALKKITQSIAATEHWAWLPLVSNERISAGILYLPADSQISPNKSGFNLTMHQSQLQAPFSNTLDSEPAKQHYLGLEGNTSVDIHYGLTKSNVLLKHGDSVVTMHESTNIDRISAIQGASLVLSIQLAAN